MRGRVMGLLFFWRHRSEGHKRPSAQESALATNAPFMAMKDEREVRRLNEQHFAIQQDLGGNYGAPLASPKAILDIGCGTGRWAIEMATAFPDAQVIGIDVILPDPTASLGLGIATLPHNVSFMQTDATQSLPFANKTFDYIHLCLLYAVIP